MENTVYFNAVKVISVCMFWYVSSASGNVIGKMVLSEFPYPMTVTMVQLVSTSLYLIPIIKIMGMPIGIDLPRRYYWSLIFPLAMGKFVSSVSSHISLWKVSVSYAHTVKATLPMFTVIMSRIFFGEKQTLLVYLSLLPIIGGVVIATLTEVSFDLIGLGSALFATVGFSLQTIFSKKVLKDTGLHHFSLLHTLSKVASLSFLPIWFLFDLTRIINSDHMTDPRFSQTMVLLFLDGFFNMLQNIFAFTILAMVAPLSYAVANATKRVVVIGVSLLLLKNPVTSVNILGMLVAITGVLAYNKAKYDQNTSTKREHILPRVQSDSNIKVHHLKTPKHSKTEICGQNGFVHNSIDHILLQNNSNFEHVTLIPVSDHPHTEESTTSEIELELPPSLHSRSVHHV